MLIAMQCNVMQSVGRYSHAHKNPFQHWISKRIANRLFTVELGLEQHARVSKPTERYRRQRLLQLEALEPHGWPQATYDFTLSLSDYDGGWQVRARLSPGPGS